MILEEYGKIFIEKIARLSFSKKIILGVCFLQRQISAVQLFDTKYNEVLSQTFLESINKIIDYAKDGNITFVESDLNCIEGKIPDTEEYQDVEGIYAQNALISTYYMLLFILGKSDGNLYLSLDKYLESVDVLNQESVNKINDDELFMLEIDTLSFLLTKVISIDDINDKSLNTLFLESRKYSLI